MKKLLCLCLILSLLLGCAPITQNFTEETVQFYYRSTADDIYFSGTGIIAAEARPMIWEKNSITGLIEHYLHGPTSDALISPFPEDMQLIRLEINGREITLVFDDSLASLSTIGLRVAASCIARTLWEYGSYETVTLMAQSQPLGDADQLVLHPAELVLSDRTAGKPNTLVRLFFADSQNRFLMEEQRNAGDMDENALPDFILRALIAGPQSQLLEPTIPKGTMLLGLSVVEHVCIVNFSSEFLQNRPKHEAEERMTIFSVVNSLTQLDSIDTVEIVVEGRSIPKYSYLDLSHALTYDEALIGPVRSGVGEFRATLYVCLEGDHRLSAFPMRLKPAVNVTPAHAVLNALAEFRSRNGYYSPLALHGGIESVQEADGSITVDLSAKTLEDCEDEQELQMLLRSIVATLKTLPDIQNVNLRVDGTPLPEVAPVSDNWFCDP